MRTAEHRELHNSPSPEWIPVRFVNFNNIILYFIRQIIRETEESRKRDGGRGDYEKKEKEKKKVSGKSGDLAGLHGFEP